MKTYTKTIESPRLKIVIDDCPSSPREWSNLGYFITVDRHYHSPDRNEDIEHIVKETGNVASSQEEHIKMIKKEMKERTGEKVVAIYPISKYEHSGIIYSIGDSFGFDYSNNGFYIVTDKTVKELGTPKKSFEKVIAHELETYNRYINGEVYGFILYDENGEVEDSCFGFYDIAHIREYLPEDFKDENLSDYIVF